MDSCNKGYSFCFLNHTDALKSNYIFKGISADVIGKIIKETHYRVKTFHKGQHIACNGETYNNLYIILQGSIVEEITDFEGKVIRLEELKAPEIIESLFIFGDDNTLPLDVTSTSETHMLIIPRKDLIRIFTHHEQVMQNYLNIIANQAQYLSKKIKLLELNSIRSKIAHYLLEQMKIEGNTDFIIKRNQRDLAHMFGVSRPSLTRVLRELHNDGIISAVGKHITIIDKKALSQFLR